MGKNMDQHAGDARLPNRSLVFQGQELGVMETLYH